MAGDILNGWKDISSFLGRSVRTAQRFEVELGMPVRRPRGHKHSSVFARRDELQRWLDTIGNHPQRGDGQANRQVSRRDGLPASATGGLDVHAPIGETTGAHRRSDQIAAWRYYVAKLGAESPLREVIIDSWQRCVASGISASSKELALHRVPKSELESRLANNAELIAAAKPHLQWLATTLAEVPHVAYIVDSDGIVLYATGNDPIMRQQFGLVPGYDWSERRMGTNGAGTALICDKPVAVIGREHFREVFDDCTCTGAPIHAPDGRLIGAVDISTSARDSDPSRLAMVAHAAVSIEESLLARRLSKANKARASRVTRPPRRGRSDGEATDGSPFNDVQLAPDSD